MREKGGALGMNGKKQENKNSRNSGDIICLSLFFLLLPLLMRGRPQSSSEYAKGHSLQKIWWQQTGHSINAGLFQLWGKSQWHQMGAWSLLQEWDKGLRAGYHGPAGIHPTVMIACSCLPCKTRIYYSHPLTARLHLLHLMDWGQRRSFSLTYHAYCAREGVKYVLHREDIHMFDCQQENAYSTTIGI